jgi:glutamine synthetase
MRVCLEYIWLGGAGELRSKTKVYDISHEDLLTEEASVFPDWNYDGSSTAQAEGTDSEVILKPRASFMDPFRGSPHRLVMCDTYRPDGTPLESNHRAKAVELFSINSESKPWYGLEQEYFLMKKTTDNKLQIIGFNEDGSPVTGNGQGQYYCGVGTNNAFGRKIVESHLSACLNAGVKLSGINAEVAPGQWEFQVGPCEGIEAGDHLWMARYILQRVGECFGVVVNYEPKPITGDWNGSGCHTNFSTAEMREEGGFKHIKTAIDKLSKVHTEHMNVYGTGNELRMTGEHETADYQTFSAGVADRGRSIRIGNLTNKNKRGYFEDRRPSSNCDPYQVTSKMYETIVIN